MEKKNAKPWRCSATVSSRRCCTPRPAPKPSTLAAWPKKSWMFRVWAGAATRWPLSKAGCDATARKASRGCCPSGAVMRAKNRVISDQLSAHISELLARYPRMPVNRLREQLTTSGHIPSRRISEATLRRHIRQAGLRPQTKPAPQARKHFEKPHANDLWVMDFMHGPRVRVGRPLHKTYLAARPGRPLPVPDRSSLLHSGKLPGSRLRAQESLRPPRFAPDPLLRQWVGLLLQTAHLGLRPAGGGLGAFQAL